MRYAMAKGGKFSKAGFMKLAFCAAFVLKENWLNIARLNCFHFYGQGRYINRS